MGQQQLLLLVLSTVIVGLATVAGIQAFSENQAQATQDALIQRATSVASDIVAAHNKPTQMGGIDVTSASDNSKVASAVGLSGASFDADGAGEGATCNIKTSSSNSSSYSISEQVVVNCSSGDGATVEVGVDPSADDQIETVIVSTASV
ncbi:hypothetical protein [Salinibacter ruber]|uniref:hypothetical protein n=1 Tax=Salinibacter ruber TaxID=146919 RepID=UPI002167AAAB|nr:hypothetical protein [Salinibacter ruber]MCS3648508.1 hypothetical protein [Salinibacter ruber]